MRSAAFPTQRPHLNFAPEGSAVSSVATTAPAPAAATRYTVLRLRSATRLLATAMLAALPSLAAAQVTPAAGYTPPDDTPVIRVGTTIFANYSYTKVPDATDADGNTIKNNSFDVARAYINISGNISHTIAFRVTPDIMREANTSSASLAGNLVFRVKYAYLQTNLDEWTGRGSYARFGIQQTPYLDFLENIYRYRFQGTLFTERIGLFASADAGASYRYQFGSNYGDIHVGVYNGENYNRAEVNDQKAIMIRGTLRPFAKGAPILRGLRVTGFYDTDHYISEGERIRQIGTLTYEHPIVNVGFEYMHAEDQTPSATSNKVNSNGYSIWATPKMGTGSVGFEGLLRYDHQVPNTSYSLASSGSAGNGTTLLRDQTRDRIITGIAYWFPHTGSQTTAIMLDYDAQMFDNTTARPTQTIFVHALVNY